MKYFIHIIPRHGNKGLIPNTNKYLYFFIEFHQKREIREVKDYLGIINWKINSYSRLKKGCGKETS